MQSPILAKIFGDKEDPRRRLAELFPDAPNPEKYALAWAGDTLQAARIDPVASEIEAIRCLREAQPNLTLKTARYLVSRLRSS